MATHLRFFERPKGCKWNYSEIDRTTTYNNFGYNVDRYFIYIPDDLHWTGL